MVGLHLSIYYMLKTYSLKWKWLQRDTSKQSLEFSLRIIFGYTPTHEQIIHWISFQTVLNGQIIFLSRKFSKHLFLVSNYSYKNVSIIPSSIFLFWYHLMPFSNLNIFMLSPNPPQTFFLQSFLCLFCFVLK